LGRATLEERQGAAIFYYEDERRAGAHSKAPDRGRSARRLVVNFAKLPGLVAMADAAGPFHYQKSRYAALVWLASWSRR